MRLALLVLLVAVAAGCGQAQVPATSGADSSTSPAPAAPPADDVKLSIESYQGIQDTIAAQKGKVVVMDAWSTSCPPCIKEFHNLVELHKQYGADQVACISLSFDYEGIGKPEEQVDRVLDFLRSQGATFTNLMSNEETDVLYKKFDLAAVPAVFVYDREGKLAKRFDNEQAKRKEDAFTYEQVRTLVAELLAAEPTEAEPAEGNPTAGAGQ
jgi:thiol-disulfide isomerase/thioredoxin